MKISGELDYRIRYDVEHDLFHAQNVFNDEYITPTFVEYVQKLEKENAELKEQVEKMKCCENCGWYYLQQHWRESKEINESRMFHCGTCGNKRNWKLREIKEND